MTDIVYHRRARRPSIQAIVGVIALGFSTAAAIADDFERPPIVYSQATPENVITRLQRRIDGGEIRLTYEPRFGYLRSVLEALDIPLSSQTLVFSKTSLQRHRISPRRPRAIYFNDEAYIGFCQSGDVIEASAVDPVLGAVFYTLDQKEVDHPRFTRQTDSCLQCHGSSLSRHVPGHLVRSVYVDGAGQPVLSMGSHRIDHASPIEVRWGGWYVTGTHGALKHLGNLTVEAGIEPEAVDNAAGQNVIDLSDRIDVRRYLAPHSDIVALMVLEHQADVHNLLTQANFQTRMALHYEQVMNRDLNQPAGRVWDSARSRIRSACGALVEGLLMSGEPTLAAELRGTTTFVGDFSQRGPRDPDGRSLRDLDLRRRLFKHPCSYLINSKAFDALPVEAKQEVYWEIGEILNGRDTNPAFAHLSDEDKRAIREILLATKSDLPADWRVGGD